MTLTNSLRRLIGLPVYSKNGRFTTGQRVRTAEMNGCMAHVRERVREGTIVEFVECGSYEYAVVQMDDGGREKRITELNQWTAFEGLWEYRI